MAGLVNRTIKAAFVMLLVCVEAIGQVNEPLPRCEIIPAPQQQFVLRTEGITRAAWHFSNEYERPFFFPLKGPSGSSLTRMGHPGAPNHDHHRSVWFAHHDVDGLDFWSNQSPARLRQKHWYALVDGRGEAVMAVALGWFDGQGREVMQSDVVAAMRPVAAGETLLELQLVCRVPEGRQEVTLGKTNFGFLAVRVAKSISAFFGDGTISDSEGRMGEPQIFGQRARWMDYSGSIPVGQGVGRGVTTEGITYFDHPDNPRYPTHWHVREDGWMGASFCMQQSYIIRPTEPLSLRYLLHAHAGGYDAKRTEETARAFGKSKAFEIRPSQQKHRQYDVRRVGE